MTLKVILSAVLGGVLLFTGFWYASALGGFVAGVWVLRRGWLYGGIAVSMAWAVLTVWNLAAAPAEVANLGRIMGAFAGVPSWLMPPASIAFGFLLGAAAGFVGSSISTVFSQPSAS